MRAALVDAGARDELAPGRHACRQGWASSVPWPRRRQGAGGGRGRMEAGRAEVAATAGEAEAMKSSFEKPRPGGGDLDWTIGIGRLVINVDVAQW